MLQNYINQTELLKYHPKLATQLWSTQTDYTTQINLAFDLVMDRLHNMGINPGRVYTALDLTLASSTSDKNVPPQYVTITGTTTGSAYESRYEKRVVLDITDISGSFNFYVDGNRKTSEPTAADNGWEQATYFAVTQSYEGSKVTQVLDKTYNYLRYRIAPTTGAGTTITTSIIMLPTSFDTAVLYKTLEIIHLDLVKEEGDIFDYRRKAYTQLYEEALSSAKYAYDANENSEIDDDEEAQSSMNITLVR